MGILIKKIVLGNEIRNIWRFITEPKNFPKYIYSYNNGKITSPNKTGIGASYEWYGKLGPFKLKSTEETVEWQERKHVAYTGKLFGIKFNSSMSVKEIKKQTQLTVYIRYEVPLYLGGVITDLLIIRGIIKEYIKKSLDNLKEIYN